MTLINKAAQLFKLENFNELTPIQEQIFNPAIKRRDLIAQSATGTGKTHAFLFPLANQLDETSNNLQAIIIAPTRELATQIHQFALTLKEISPDLRIELITGGMDRERMKKKMVIQPHLVIGTPGRIKDMFFEGVLRCDQADTVILDEADMIYEFGFLEDVDMILTRMNKKVHMMVFSATIPDQLKPFIKRYLHKPLTFNVTEDSPLNPDVKHILIHQKHKEPQEVLLDLLPLVQPSGCIIFVNTRKIASEVSEYLRDHGYQLLELHGDLTPRKRQQTLTRLQNEDLVYLVATDIAARGLDLPHVSHVISLGFPSQLEFYIHRIGRTGRAGKSGVAYTIVSQEDQKSIERLSSTGIKFHYEAITNNVLKEVRNFFTKRKRPSKVDPEIAQILNRKDKKVKPNYKKKRKAQIEKLQRKKRREKIQSEIQQQKKERAKAKQKEKSNI